MQEETITIAPAANSAADPLADPAADPAVLAALGALGGSAAGFAHPHGPDLMRRVEALGNWCTPQSLYGAWQCTRATGQGAVRALATPLQDADIDFASEDHLGLASSGAVRAAALSALQEGGPQGAASGLRSDRNSRATALEAALGALLHAEQVTLLPTGWGAAFGAITTLVHGRDHVVIDEAAQAALRQGAAAATRNVTLHQHLDTVHVRQLLAEIRARDEANGILLVTEGLFDSEADSPDLALMQHLCREYGATLLVDVAHDLGVMGPQGSGQLGLQAMLGKVDIVSGAFANSFAAEGGFVACASSAVKRRLRLLAGAQPAGNALAPVQAAVVLAALDIAASDAGEVLRAELAGNVLALRAHLSTLGVCCMGTPSPIVPVWTGSEAVARLAATWLAQEGVFVGLAEYPAVALGTARLRLLVSAHHRHAQLRDSARLIAAALRRACAALGVAPLRPYEFGMRRRG